MKKFLCIEVLFIIAVLFSGCGFHIAKPEKFGIKTSDEAEYNLAIADKSFELGEFFSMDKFLKDDDSEEGESGQTQDEKPKYEIFKYDPARNENKIQQFLLRMDLQKIPLDLGSSLSGAEITTTFDNMGFTKDISVPNVNRTEEKEVNLAVNQKVNALVTIYGETGPRSEVHFASSESGTNNGFTSIEYQSGFMTIKEDSTTTTQKITGEIILTKDDKELSRATFNASGVAELPLSGVIIEKEGLIFSFTESSNVSFIASVNPESVVKRAEGLTIEEGVPITAHQEISIGNASELETYTIGTGDLSVLLKLPSLWENQVEYDYTMILSNALNATLTKDNPTKSLNNTTFFEHSELVTDVTGKFYLNNATLDFIEGEGENQKNVNPTIAVVVNVSKIESATMKLENEYKMVEPQNSPLPEDVLSNIKTVLWDKYGFSISCVNTLPEGNPITIQCSSDFFELKDIPTVTLPNTYPSTDGAEPEAVLLSNFVNETTTTKEYKTEIGEGSGQFSSVDVDATINISGYDKDNRTLTMRNLTPGQTYKIDIKVTPVLEWNTMWINTEDRHENGKVSTGLNLSSIFGSLEETVGSDVASNLAFSRIPLYLFAETPTLQDSETNAEVQAFFKKIKFNGIVKAYIGNDDCEPVTDEEGNVTYEYLLGKKVEDAEKKADLEFEQGLSLVITDDKVVTTDIEIELGNNQNTDSEGSGSSKQYANLANLLNRMEDGSLCVDYDIGLSQDNPQSQESQNDVISITKSQLEEMKKSGSTSISLSVLCIIPLEFTVKDDIHMNLLKLIGIDKGEGDFDLMGRTEEPDNTTINEFAKAIRDVKIIYEPSKIPFIVEPYGSVDEMSLIIDMDGIRGDSTPQELSISGDTITVLPSEVLKYPLSPVIELLIPKGKLLIPQESVFDTKLYIKIATSGEIIWLDSFKSKNEGGNE